MLIGTSGWQYRDWRGGLYPAGVAQRRWLEHYASYYLTVENNASFYRLPAEQTFAGWQARTPGDFVMAVKASRYLTHVRKLRDPEEPVARLLGAAAALGPKLGPVLLQLPPTLKAEPALLDACLTAFRRAPLSGHGPLRITVEPRHSSWWTEEVRQILAASSASEGVLKGEQGVVRVRQGAQDLVEFALRCPLVPRLGVLDDEDHRECQRGDQGLEDGLPPCRKPRGQAHPGPCHDHAEDQQGNRWAGRIPVYPGEPAAERRPGPFLRRV
jgi:uncharacterized protein YecE (DUF72 family)